MVGGREAVAPGPEEIARWILGIIPTRPVGVRDLGRSFSHPALCDGKGKGDRCKDAEIAHRAWGLACPDNFRIFFVIRLMGSWDRGVWRTWASDDPVFVRKLHESPCKI